VTRDWPPARTTGPAGHRCCSYARSRWHQLDPARSAGLVAVAELLLNAGADPDTAVAGSARGGRCATLYAAAGLANHPALTTLLLDRGADPDTPAALYHTVFHPDHDCLRLLLQRGARAVLDALLDAGADIDAPGAVIGGGTPLADARGFAQWQAAHRLVQRGARTTLQDAATLGLLDQVREAFTSPTPPGPDELDRAFWGACHGGQQSTAAFLLDRGADVNWIPPWEPLTPLDAATRSGATDLVQWLRTRTAESGTELD
jgi:ankyrin repeat protein